MAGSEGTAAPPAAVRGPVAAQATQHSLTGCAIGEVQGMVTGNAAGLPISRP